MSETPTSEKIVYAQPPKGNVAEKRLVAIGGPEPGRAFEFYEELQIGRLKPGAAPGPGCLLVSDPTVSSKHCVISQDDNGRCFVRDLSLNGTWIDGRRLVPGAEVELKPGQEIFIGQANAFRLAEEVVGSHAGREVAEARSRPREPTNPVSPLIEATVVIGDIGGYTSLVREAPADLLQASMTALFQALEGIAADNGGTVKEYPGDAMLSYWEQGSSGNSAVRACRAALALHEAACRLARDKGVWMLREMPLRMEWALATGPVTVRRLGGTHPVGLSLVGEPVVKAYRLEKVACQETGPIVVCGKTRQLASEAFRFLDLGEKELEGFPQPERIYALLGTT